MATTKEFCDNLRLLAKKLASGELPEYIITDATIDGNLDEQDQKKVNASYIRTIMNRVPEVKEIGTVSISRTDPIEDAPGFRIVINRDTKRRIVTTNDLPAIKEHEREKLVEKIMRISPDFSHLDDEKALVAMRAVATFKDLIKEIAK